MLDAIGWIDFLATKFEATGIFVWLFWSRSYHYASGDRNATTAVSVWHYVSEAHAQERDRYEPHGVQQVSVIFIMKPTEPQTQCSIDHNPIPVKKLNYKL